jgi:hypothetical protein
LKKAADWLVDEATDRAPVQPGKSDVPVLLKYQSGMTTQPPFVASRFGKPSAREATLLFITSTHHLHFSSSANSHPKFTMGLSVDPDRSATDVPLCFNELAATRQNIRIRIRQPKRSVAAARHGTRKVAPDERILSTDRIPKNTFEVGHGHNLKELAEESSSWK